MRLTMPCDDEGLVRTPISKGFLAETAATVLNMGADDYLTKPFATKILRAGVKALSRRHGSTPMGKD